MNQKTYILSKKSTSSLHTCHMQHDRRKWFSLDALSPTFALQTRSGSSKWWKQRLGGSFWRSQKQSEMTPVKSSSRPTCRQCCSFSCTRNASCASPESIPMQTHKIHETLHFEKIRLQSKKGSVYKITSSPGLQSSNSTKTYFVTLTFNLSYSL